MSQTPQYSKPLYHNAPLNKVSKSTAKLECVDAPVQHAAFRKFGEYAGPEGPKENIWGGSPCK